MFWLCWVFLAVCGLSLVAASKRLLSRGGGWASHCSGFSRHRAQTPEGSGCNGCGAWAHIHSSSWNLPGAGIEPVSPALAGARLSPGPPGQSWVDMTDVKYGTHFRCTAVIHYVYIFQDVHRGVLLTMHPSPHIIFLRTFKINSFNNFQTYCMKVAKQNYLFYI